MTRDEIHEQACEERDEWMHEAERLGSALSLIVHLANEGAPAELLRSKALEALEGQR